MSFGEWFGASLGFIVVMLGAMFAAVGLVVYAAVAAMRGSVAGEAPEAIPAAPARRETSPGVPVRPGAAEPVPD